MTLLFIFDMDDVLYDYDFPTRIANLSALTGLTEKQLLERWWDAGYEEQAEAGAYDADGYISAFSAAIGVEVSAADWVRVRGGAMTPLPDSIAAVERAAQLGQVTLLTNNGALSGLHIGTLAPELVPLFGEHLFTSSSYRARKPEPEVFQAVLNRYGVAASDAFFADDLETNVAGARSVGITAHRFTDGASLRAAIEDFAAAHE